MSAQAPRRALLLSNIGSPAAPETANVRRYLREFLMDPDVITAPAPVRWFLVNGIIAPFRARASAAKYREIWTARGSPLLSHSDDFAGKLQAVLGPEWVVRAPMRYGQPGFGSTLRELPGGPGGFQEIILCPMFPQVTPSTTGSALKAFKAAAAECGFRGRARVLEGFHSREAFAETLARKLRNEAAAFAPDYWLFSFHGLPESHLRIPGNLYRDECVATAEDLAKRMGLEANGWTYSFQSRLGPTKWIGPHTDALLKTLPARGVRRLAVAAPSFVADCLETLEELAIQGRQTFLEAGGADYFYLSCLNASEDWVAAFARLLDDPSMLANLREIPLG